MSWFFLYNVINSANCVTSATTGGSRASAVSEEANYAFVFGHALTVIRLKCRYSSRLQLWSSSDRPLAWGGLDSTGTMVGWAPETKQEIAQTFATTTNADWDDFAIETITPSGRQKSIPAKCFGYEPERCLKTKVENMTHKSRKITFFFQIFFSTRS